MNYNNWPWGEQNCTYIAGSWTYDMENLDIKPSLGSSPQSMRDSPLDFTHLLDESGVSTSFIKTLLNFRGFDFSEFRFKYRATIGRDDGTWEHLNNNLAIDDNML